MTYWIFTSKCSEDDFSKIIDSKKWGFKKNKKDLKNLQSFNDKLKVGNIIILYHGGKGRYYFAGEATLSSKVGLAERRGFGGKIDFTVEMSNIQLWDDKQKFRLGGQENLSNREALDMIQNKENWGRSIQKSIVYIGEKDYKKIKKFVRKASE